MSDASDAAPEPLVSPIAHPLADAKLCKKVLKVVKKGAWRFVLRPLAGACVIAQPPLLLQLARSTS